MEAAASHFKALVETIIFTGDFEERPERIFELIQMLNEADASSVTAVKDFLLKSWMFIDDEFVIKLVSMTDKKLLYNEPEIQKLFEGNDDMLLFLRL